MAEKEKKKKNNGRSVLPGPSGLYVLCCLRRRKAQSSSPPSSVISLTWSGVRAQDFHRLGKAGRLCSVLVLRKPRPLKAREGSSHSHGLPLEGKKTYRLQKKKRTMGSAS